MTTTPTQSPYGNCPVCGSPTISRERRPGGNDKCANGHLYKSSASVTRAAPMSEAELEREAGSITNYYIEDIEHPLTSVSNRVNAGLEIINLAKKYRGES